MLMDLLPMLAAAANTAGALADGGGDIVEAARSGIRGTFALGAAGAGAGIGVGLTGLGAAQSVGRNPGAFGKILTIALIGMALSEAIAIYGLLVYFIDK